MPGDTMLERKLWFEANSDELRLLLMREPRGHGAMSGAILQPPTRPDADFGVLFIEVSGCLPMCGHGTIGVATVLVETGMVAVTEPVTTVALDTPAGLVRSGWTWPRGGRARSRCATCRRTCCATRRRWRCPGWGRSPMTWPSAATSTRSSGGQRRRGALSRAGDPADRGRPRDHDRDQRRRPAGASRRRPHRRLPPCRPARARRRRSRTPGPRSRSTRMVGPLAVRHRHQSPGWRSCMPAGRWPSASRSSTSP